LGQALPQVPIGSSNLVQIGLDVQRAAGSSLSFQTAAAQSEAPATELTAAALNAVGDATDFRGVSSYQGLFQL
jgi:hypothetical protein